MTGGRETAQKEACVPAGGGGTVGAGGGSRRRAVRVGVCSVAGPWQQGGYTFTCAHVMPLRFGDGSQKQPAFRIHSGLGPFPVG